MSTETELDYVAVCQARWQEDPFLSIAELFRELQAHPNFHKSYETVHRHVMALRPTPEEPVALKTARARVAEATAAKAALAAKVDAALAVQIDAVQAALAAGVGATELSRMTGLSISRIHQMRLAA